MKTERFEDLIAWQKARVLTKAIYQISREGNFSKDFGLASQIQHSTVSVMSNIAEGYERGNLNEYIYFLRIARASCGEVRSQLYIALDIGYIQQDDFSKLLPLAEDVSRVIRGLYASLKRNQ